MLKAIDFFCGGGGMSHGLTKAGITVLAGIDNDPKVGPTYLANHVGSRFINEDISKLETSYLRSLLGITKNDDSLVFVGCSPCQYWSLIKTDKSKSKKTANLLEYFQKHVEYFLPGYILIENVPGLALRDESPLQSFKNVIEKLGYYFSDGVLNCNDYDVPQNRMRYVLLASRNGVISLPEPRAGRKPVLRDAIGESRTQNLIVAGHSRNDHFFHSACKLSPINLRRIKATPKDGGNRLAWKANQELQVNAYIGKDNCFRDVYARLYWDKPAPTITTKFISYSNGRFGHPEQDRALSVREGAALQSFPKSFKIISNSIVDAARMVGNAVPPKLAQALGQSMIGNYYERHCGTSRSYPEENKAESTIK